MSLSTLLVYLSLGVGAALEGPVLMMSSGLLLRLGYLSLAPLVVAFVIGDLVGDIIWYLIGYWVAKPFLHRFGWWFGLTTERFEQAKALIHRHQERILFISKITLGFGMAIGVILAAGAARLRFRRFILINLSGELVLVPVLLAIGYFFGEFLQTSGLLNL
ncbi:MAG: VTT domain-containing protein [Candidatus Vogelbacteria bacterium]|nr:VTT domain-containing protein [Candidatus Vogelbacteria bacterium]